MQLKHDLPWILWYLLTVKTLVKTSWFALHILFVCLMDTYGLSMVITVFSDCFRFLFGFWFPQDFGPDSGVADLPDGQFESTGHLSGREWNSWRLRPLSDHHVTRPRSLVDRWGSTRINEVTPVNPVVIPIGSPHWLWCLLGWSLWWLWHCSLQYALKACAFEVRQRHEQDGGDRLLFRRFLDGSCFCNLNWLKLFTGLFGYTGSSQCFLCGRKVIENAAVLVH